MTKQTFDINKLRVASPCSVPWEAMSGGERVRRCGSCELNIYNIAEMTESEIEHLIANREERLCIRLYKRADGTVLTKDCPVGLRAYQKRIARFAGAALATILGLFSVSYGQNSGKKTLDASRIKIVKTLNQSQKGSLGGVISDPNGALVPGAAIKLYKKSEKKKPIKTATDSEGNYAYSSLSAGIYILEIESPGFKKYKIVNIEIKDGEKNQLDMTIEANVESLTVVGLYGEEPLIDITSSSVQTNITKEMMNRLPH